MFKGRKEELETLESMHGSGNFEFAVVYGRRRVGKTTLIRRFCEGRRAFYFVARESSASENLKLVSRELAACGLASEGTVFENWDAVLRLFAQLSQNERLIVAIDEFPYLAAAESGITSAIQAYADGSFKNSKLFLILSGSSMSFMENQILGHKSPLYGRRTAQFKLQPFDYFVSREFLPGFSPEEQLTLYAVTGGIPEYLSKIDNTISLKENIVRLFLTDSGIMFEEPANLLKQELREPAVYNSLITAIAGGASKLNETASKTGMDTNKAAKYLGVLMSLGIVKREYPAGEIRGKKSLYSLDDGIFRFYYRYVFTNMSAITSGSGSLLYDAEIKNSLPEFCAPVFEKVCAEYLLRLQKNRKLPFFIGSLGRWWGANPHTKKPEEIDLMAISHNKGLFCECKWRSVPADLAIFETLAARSKLFNLDERHYIIFSKSGFDKKLQAKASALPQLSLISFEEINKLRD